MEKSFGLQFHLKKNKFESEDLGTIYLKITVNGCYAEISTKHKCNRQNWSASAKRVKGKTENAKSINTYLELLQRKVYEARRQLLDQDQEVSAENIKQIMQGKTISSQRYMLMEIFQKHNEQLNELVGREFAPATFTRYQTSLKHTRAFLQDRYQTDDIDISALNYEFISDYEFWLKTARRCDHNTAMKYLSNFRKIVNRCIRNGWLVKDPFLGFKMTKREVEKTALTEGDLAAIEQKHFQCERLRIVRDIFLFSCYTGLAYADVYKLKPEELVMGVDGEQWICARRRKTEIMSRIPLLPPALSILQKYQDYASVKSKGRVLPVLSNQKMNAYLKEIGDCCGITKHLTFHIARHTFATTITLSNGVPIETVSKMLGHRNLKTTQHYARIVDRKISADMLELKARLQRKQVIR